MCDTIVALGAASREGNTLFGKNSDREPDETQNIAIVPHKTHKDGEEVKCTYITIPQAPETARILLCRPFWMFGAEMGANEYGVMIGNEALFTREKPSLTGLTGMDLLRLALERSKSAREALDTIIVLLEKYGQGGNCGYRQKFYYMNSFLIADAAEAYVLETVKSWWAWKQVRDVWSISNMISLEKDYDCVSPGLIENAVNRGWCKTKDDFNFQKCYTNPLITWGAAARSRQTCSRNLLLQKKGLLTTADFMAILRDHGGHDDFHPSRYGGTICMHAADRFIRRSQSVGSMVANVNGKEQHYYVTGAGNPCLSPFFPVFSSGTLTPAGYLEGAADYNGEAFWWQCEKLHRQALWRFPAALKDMQVHTAAYEQEMLQSLEEMHALVNQAIVDSCFARVRNMVNDWGDRLNTMPETSAGWLFRRYWHGYKSLNGI